MIIAGLRTTGPLAAAGRGTDSEEAVRAVLRCSLRHLLLRHTMPLTLGLASPTYSGHIPGSGTEHILWLLDRCGEYGLQSLQ